MDERCLGDLNGEIVRIQQVPNKTLQHLNTIYMECSICLDTINKEKNCWVTRCEHTFHGECLMKWYVSDQTCPMCRSDIGLGMIGNETMLLNQMELTTYRWRTESKSLGLIFADAHNRVDIINSYDLKRYTGIILEGTVLASERRELILVSQGLKQSMACGACGMWGHTRRNEACPNSN